MINHVFFFAKKCGGMGNGVYTFESTWHVHANITIRCVYICSSAHADHLQTSCLQPCLEMGVCKVEQHVS
jgi:hypothetical protein